EYLTTPGQHTSCSVQIIKRNESNVLLKSIGYPDQDSSVSLSLQTNELYTFKHNYQLSKSLPYSNPYWLNEKHSSGLYVVKNPMLVGNAINEEPLTVSVIIQIDDLQLRLMRPIVYKYTDPVKGEIYRPLEIL